jgi:outer membrane murein-binding lipoprotein Lpp
VPLEGFMGTDGVTPKLPDDQFNQIIREFQNLNAKVDGLVSRVDGLEIKVDALVSKVGGVEAKVEDMHMDLGDKMDVLASTVLEVEAKFRRVKHRLSDLEQKAANPS